MSKHILTEFSRIPELNQSLTAEFVQDLVEYCAMFEAKGSLALNTPLLGVTPIYFTSTDRDILFKLVGVEEETIAGLIDNVPGIDPNWNVARDEYNHLVLWLVHRFFISSLPQKTIELAMFTLLKLLHYKFFTSIVFNSYKHGADPHVMESVISKLSNKYDVIKEKTWKGVIEARSKDVYSNTSIHFKVLKDYTEDTDVIYLLSDIQSRIRQKIRLITELYYQSKEQGNMIGSYSTVDTIDGEKVILSQSNIFDTMIEGMIIQCQTTSRFLDNELIRILCTKFQYVSEDMLRSVLTMMTETAAVQASSGDLFKTKKTREGEMLYLGIGMIVKELIQKTYRVCTLDKINMNSKSSILLKTMNLYTSSRITATDILTIKRSLLYFVIGCKKSSRDATNSSLVIALVLYLMIRSFDFLK